MSLQTDGQLVCIICTERMDSKEFCLLKCGHSYCSQCPQRSLSIQYFGVPSNERRQNQLNLRLVYLSKYINQPRSQVSLLNIYFQSNNTN